MDKQKQALLADHLVQLAGQPEWALWRCVGLRSAGFPIEHLQALASPGSAAAAETLLTAEIQSGESRARLVGILRQRLEDSKAESQRSLLKRAIHRLERNQQPDSTSVLEGLEQEMAAFLFSRDAATAARANFEQAFASDIVQAGQAIRQVGSASLFREALLWQNRHALRTGVDVLLSRPPESRARPSKDRQKEALITSYIQRYCTKNDTIGFFGPVGWARIVDQGPLLKMEPGPELLAARQVYFEEWCIETLAKTLSSDEAFRPWLVPRRMPFVHVEKSTLYVPLARPSILSPAQSAILQACDGERTAYQIATELLAARTPGIYSIDAVYAELRDLLAKRRIAWQLEVSIENLYPEQLLRQRLTGVQDEQLRATALAALAELEAGKEEVASATGNAAQLEQAIERLETTFARITHASATRHAGEMYAGRSLIYEDCRRDITVELGSAFAQTLGPPLSLLLTSARWFTFEAARLYQQAFQKIYNEMVTSARKPVISLSSFWLYAHELLFGKQHPMLTTLTRSLQERWGSILALPTGQQEVIYQTEELRSQVEDLFAAPQAGWLAAYYHSPDVMIAASSPEAINAGDFHYILGEIHPGANTLQSAFFTAQHPRPWELLQAISNDRSQPRMIPVASRELGGATARMSNGFALPDDWRLVFAHDSCDIPGNQAVPIGSLVLEQVGDRLIVSPYDGRQSWDLIDLLGGFLMHQVLHIFDILPSARHTPRISFDRLVVHRETWSFEAQEYEFASIEQEAERFLAVRRWRNKHHLPRCMFVKTPGERKPQYVDLDSLLSVDVLARIVRQARHTDTAAESIVFSEMLPDLSECWLQDRQQQHYTSEFRLVAVDRDASAARPGS
jgi:hypothetical protein